MVFGVTDDENSEHQAFASFLRYLTDQYGPSDGRHSDERIYIIVGPGDKHPDYKCPYCGEEEKIVE